MKTVHVILQGKGGVGKSLISSILCQYYIDYKKENVIAIDTDPVNQTLAQYKALDVICLDLKDGIIIDSRKIDELTNIVLSEEEGTQIIVDNGASSFIPFASWLIENNTISFWRNNNINVLIHSVVTGGQALFDCLNGINDLSKNIIEEKRIVVWLNRYFGEISYNSKPFNEFKVYEQNADKIAAIINMPNKSRQLFGVDLAELCTRHQTFAEAAEDEVLPLMVKHRLKMWWSEMCSELDICLPSIT